ncbi:unnamed protein product, partial [Timema podura]|nr:unnamed protein product [Timema podura]
MNDVPGCQGNNLVDLPHTVAQALKLVIIIIFTKYTVRRWMEVGSKAIMSCIQPEKSDSRYPHVWRWETKQSCPVYSRKRATVDILMFGGGKPSNHVLYTAGKERQISHPQPTHLGRSCSKLVGFGPDLSPVSRLHLTWFPLGLNPTSTRLLRSRVVVEPAGLLLVKEQVQIPPTIIPPGQKGPVPFPKQLKIRHPLFGSEESRKLIGLELRLTIEYTDELQHAASLHNSMKGILRIKEEHIVKDNHSMTERRGKKRKRDSKNEILDYLNQDAVHSEPSTVLHSDNNASILDFKSESKKHKKRRLLSSGPDDGYNSTLSEDKPSRHLVKEESNTSLESTD